MHFVVDYTSLRALPPENEIVKMAKVVEGADMEEAVRSTLVDYADLAEEVLSIEETEGRRRKSR